MLLTLPEGQELIREFSKQLDIRSLLVLYLLVLQGCGYTTNFAATYVSFQRGHIKEGKWRWTWPASAKFSASLQLAEPVMI